MRVFNKLIFVLLTLILVCSCRVPKTKTEVQLNRYLERNEFNKSNQYGLSGKGYTQRLMSDKRYFYRVDLYDDKGDRVQPSDSLTRTCWGPMMDVFKNLSDTSLLETINGDNLNSDSTLTNELVFLNGKEATFPSYKEYDYTLVLYWSWWTLKNRIKQTLGFEKMVLENNPELKIQVVKINMDFRDYMEEEGYDSHESNKRIIENYQNRKEANKKST